MDDWANAYLEKTLKRWVSQRQPPGSVRARILWLAAQPVKHPGRERNPFVEAHTYQPISWSHLLLTCDIIHSYQNGLTVSRILV
jgi:hypothetical protein